MKDDGLRQRFLQENSGKEITLNEVVNATCNKTGHLAVCCRSEIVEVNSIK